MRILPRHYFSDGITKGSYPGLLLVIRDTSFPKNCIKKKSHYGGGPAHVNNVPKLLKAWIENSHILSTSRRLPYRP